MMYSNIIFEYSNRQYIIMYGTVLFLFSQPDGVIT